MKNYLTLTLLIGLMSLLFGENGFAQCPQPVNILENPGFEEYGPPCVVPPNTTVNGAFNDGCVSDWHSANQTPSICTPNPGAGTLSACLGFAPPNGSNFREAIFQTVVMCQGEDYQLSFMHRSLGTSATLNLYMASGLTNVDLTDGVAFTIDPTWQAIQTVTAGTAWTTTTFTFTANNLANNQLLIQVVGGGDAMLDEFSLVCVSHLQPHITALNLGGGEFSFTGIVPVMPPFAVVNWCWDFGDGSPTVSGPAMSAVTHTYQTSGTYQVCLTIQDNCCFCINSICIPIVYEACACGQNPQVLNTNGVVSWTNLIQNINNDVIIAPGTDLVITGCTLNIKSPCKFVVMRGASMNVQSSTLRTSCKFNKWGGIVVWGNSAIDHSNPPNGTTFSYINPVNNSATTPGVLLTGTSSVIKDMNSTGIFAQRQASDPVNEPIFANLTGSGFDPATQLGSFTGGVVRCNSTTFRDNDLSADFRDYPFNNYSQFGGCTFTTTVAPSSLSATGPVGVRIFNTDNISFQTCTFDHVGSIGISSVNGSLTMMRCSMNQHYQGLRLNSAAGQTGFVQVGLGNDQTRNYFTDNRYGIYSDGIFNLNVLTNTFENNGDLVTQGPLSTYAGGAIFASGASSFFIDDNDFSGNVYGAELLNTSGAGPNGTAASQRFKCNVHTNDRIGIRVRGRCPGMYFKDNTFDNTVADVQLLRNLFTKGEIHLNQGANNAAVFNYFSNNAPDIVSSTAAGQTVQFNYFPPLTEDQIEFDRATPDCDIHGFQAPAGGACTTLNNFINRPSSFGVKDPCLPPPSGREYVPCTDRSCLDALRTQKINLENLVLSGRTEYSSDLATVTLHFDTDKRDVAWQWYGSGHMDYIANMLTAYGTTEDLQMLYAYYTRARDYTAAFTLLQTLPATTEEETWFKGVQNIYLKYARSSGLYRATAEEDHLLETVAVTATNVGGQARAVYYLLHDTWLEPNVDTSGDDVTDSGERNKPTTNDVSGMNIAPNPAQGLVSVTVRTNQDGTICVFDLNGKLQQQFDLQAGAVLFATDALPNGMYIVQHRNADGSTVASQKLVVQH